MTFPSLEPGRGESDDALSSVLSLALASQFAQLALKSIHREYPHKFDHLVNGASEIQTPKRLHPAFHGCFDWHSAVHGHWLLVRLHSLFPELPEAGAIVQALNTSLTRENIEAEADYFLRPGRQSFERTYGWAWLLKLDEELGRSEHDQASLWRDNLAPLTHLIVRRYLEFLPKENYPIRTGVHPNTAFGLSLALDYARFASNVPLESLILERSHTYFGTNADYPAAWEPGGEDFLSPALAEADLMRRALPQAEFAEWFSRFLPETSTGRGSLLQPAHVPDRTDPKLVHLDGLNLSRAWCLRNISESLPAGDPVKSLLMEAAIRHARAALPHIASGDYVGEHWLATFATVMLAGM